MSKKLSNIAVMRALYEHDPSLKDKVRLYGAKNAFIAAGHVRTALSTQTLEGEFIPLVQVDHYPILTLELMIQRFIGVVYLVIDDKYYVPVIGLLSRKSFDGLYGNTQYPLGLGDSSRTTKSASDAYLNNTAHVFPKAYTSEYDPSKPNGLNGTTLNLFEPPVFDVTYGDVSPFLEHIRIIIPEVNDQMILLSFLAHIIQYPGKKIRWCLVLIGPPGNGKTTITDILVRIFGDKYCHTIKGDDFGNTGKIFNGWVEGKLFIIFDEIKTSDKLAAQESIKPWITNDRINIEGKGIEERTIKNTANYIACSNHNDAVYIDEDDRRLTPMYCNQKFKTDLIRDGLTPDYFDKLYRWLDEHLSDVAGYLMKYPITISMNTAPRSSTHQRAIECSTPLWQQDIAEAIKNSEEGVDGAFVIPGLITESAPTQKVKKFMERLGYFKCDNRVRIGEKRPFVYSKDKSFLNLSARDLKAKITALKLAKFGY